MGRPLNKDSILKVLDALRDGGKTWSELQALGIPEKSLHRILHDYLSYWGLAEKDESGRWTWFQYAGERTFATEADRRLALWHSRRLCLAFHAILAEIPSLWFPGESSFVARVETDGQRLKPYLEEHLKRGYPDLHSSLRRFRELNQEIREVLQDKGYGSHADAIVGLLVRSPNSSSDEQQPSRRVIGEYEVLSSSSYGPGLDQIPEEALRLVIARQKSRCDIHSSLAREFGLQVMKVREGTPMRGDCELCPRRSALVNTQGPPLV